MKRKKQIQAITFHTGACALGFLMIYPLLWLLASSFKSNDTMFQDAYSLIPKVWDAVTNYRSGLEGVGGVSFGTFFVNTVVVTVVGTAGCVMISLLAAYAFTRIKFWGSDFLFGCVMMTMMIPPQVMVVPQYIILKKLGLIDTRIALILPWFFGGAFFISRRWHPLSPNTARCAPPDLKPSSTIVAANPTPANLVIDLPPR